MDAFVERISIGPPDGMRIAVKDCIDVAGFSTRLGSRALADAPAAERHAAVVQSLLDSGCRIVGKARMHEFAYGVTGVDSGGRGPLNPLFPDRIPGGSSSGSAAAVAAGEADLALGTDTGGSVRVPAACCGLFGIKPTFGRVSRLGVTPAISSLDCVGLFASSMPAIRSAMAALDHTFENQVCDVRKVARLQVRAEPAVQRAVDEALESTALEVTPASLPSFENAFEAGLKIIAAEAWQAFGRYADDPRIGPDVAARLRAASQVGADELVEAERTRERFTAEVAALLQSVDVIVLPTLPDFPPKRSEIGDARQLVGITALTRPFNVSGHPALSVPLLTPDGLPVGLQLVGGKGDDARLCALAARLEQLVPCIIRPESE